MNIFLKIIVHFFIILFVTCFPVYIYTVMTISGYNDYIFIGGITYYIYALYWILKIKNFRSKIIFISTFQFLFVLFIRFILKDKYDYLLPILLTIYLLFQLILMLINPKYKEKNVWKTYLINFIISIFLFILGLLIWFLIGAAMPRVTY